MEWKSEGVDFWVDGELVLAASLSPRPPLGLVIWIDNQYTVASPVSGFGFGVLETEAAQRLEIEDFLIDTP